MNFLFRWVFGAAALAGLSACVGYPYESGFAVCDRAAGTCYRGCESYTGEEGYGEGEAAACRADCEIAADRCFSDAYAPYAYGGAPYGPGYVSPWYGRYGAWYPGTGYIVALGVYGGRRGYYHRGRRYYGPHGHGGYGGPSSGGGASSPPPGSSPPPPQTTPPPRRDPDAAAPARPPKGSGRRGPRKKRD